MRRREFIALGGAAAVWTLAAASAAQQSVHRLAFVHSGISTDKLTERAGPFWVRRVYQTLRLLGDVEGKNLIVERFSAEGRSERFASLAEDVVHHNPDVIILNFNDLARAFLNATSRIPLVVITGDPIAAGLLTNLARPEANLTGVSINAGVHMKRAASLFWRPHHALAQAPQKIRQRLPRRSFPRRSAHSDPRAKSLARSCNTRNTTCAKYNYAAF